MTTYIHVAAQLPENRADGFNAAYDRFNDGHGSLIKKAHLPTRIQQQHSKMTWGTDRFFFSTSFPAAGSDPAEERLKIEGIDTRHALHFLVLCRRWEQKHCEKPPRAKIIPYQDIFRAILLPGLREEQCGILSPSLDLITEHLYDYLYTEDLFRLIKPYTTHSMHQYRSEAR